MNEKNELREVFFNTSERRKYENMWAFPEYRKVSPAEQVTETLRQLMPMATDGNIGTQPSASVIDFGCGTGRVLKMFQDNGYDVLGVDIATNCLDSEMRDVVPLLVADLTCLPDMLRADFGICIDVLEHLPTAQVFPALQGISRAVGKGCFIRVANFPETHGPRLIKEPLHLTLWDQGQWFHYLTHAFKQVNFLALKEDSAPKRYSFWCVN